MATGTKHDGGKVRYDLIPVKPLYGIAKVFTFGSDKYGDRNWEKGMKISRLYAALQRHMNAFWAGEDIDPAFRRKPLVTRWVLPYDA